jgi:carbonic anhydrase
MSELPTYSAAIHSLVSGYRKFKAKHYEQANYYDHLVEYGQKPKVLVVACCDSRVDPAIVTSCQPGELFVVRNVANLVPPYDETPEHHGTSAAIEFGIKGLGVSDIIIFGHSHCGGIRALIEKSEESAPTDFIDTWMNIATPAKDAVFYNYPDCSLEEKAAHCEKASLLVSLENLSKFPWVDSCVKNNQLALHAWYFNLSSGVIERYDANKSGFSPLIDTNTL